MPDILDGTQPPGTPDPAPEGGGTPDLRSHPNVAVHAPVTNATGGGWVRTIAVAIVAGAAGATLAGGSPEISRAAPDPVAAALTATYTVESGEGQSGSAVLVTAGGHLMTSAHLVTGLEAVTVTSSTGTRETALVVGVDTLSDLAVLRVGTNPGGVLQLRLDQPAATGEEIIAVGAPFGFRNTVTRGIISGNDRVLRFGDGRTLLTGLIQTDASINPGNSGGPIVDAQARLVGISTAISTTSGVSQGVGFAVPAATVQRVLQEILENGEVAYARLGVDALDTQSRSGARVTVVTAGGSADGAGIQVGDVITSVNGAPVRSSGELVARIRELRPGDNADVAIERYGETLILRAELQKATD